MVYFGTGLPAVHGHGMEPALIDPILRVSKPAPAYAGHDLPEPPSYRNLSSYARGRYLQWLSEGRKDEQIPIGFVFLFFFGLERRLLADECSPEEQAELIAEIGRLRTLYSADAAFDQVSFRLLEFLQAKELDAFYINIEDYAAPPVHRTWDQPYSCRLRVGLGQCAILGMDVPASWALAWAESHPGYRQRTAATRCRAEFEELFRIDYENRFPYGLSLRADGPQIQFQYQAVSASFARPVKVRSTFPDVTGLEQPGATLKEIAMSCLERLDAYSRFTGRNPELGRSGPALALLPEPLFKNQTERMLPDLGCWLETNLQDGFGVVTGRALLERVGLRCEGLSRKEMVLLSQFLERLDVGTEPDPRFGAALPDVNDPVVLFRLEEERPTCGSTAYFTAVTALSLTVAIKAADKTASAEQDEALERKISEVLPLSDGEKFRLRARRRLLLKTGVSLSSLRKQIRLLSFGARESIGQVLLEVASAAGQMSPSVIDTLMNVYRLLDLPPKRLFSAAHVCATEPISVSQFQAGPACRITIPNPPTRDASPDLAINMDKVRALVSESDRVSALLGEIFVEKEQPGPPEERTEHILRLNGPQSNFLATILKQTKWSRAELERIAMDCQLLLEGTLDLINERALEDYADLLLEGDDPIELNPIIAGELKNEYD
jgi:hypothetical protein